MIFSHRYRQALKTETISVDLDSEVRSKLATWATRFNDSVYVQRDPNDRWVDNSCAAAEVVDVLLAEYGWSDIPGMTRDQYPSDRMQGLMLMFDPAWVFDVLELVWKELEPKRAEAFRLKVNEILEVHEVPWRLQDAEFFKLDTDFVGARLSVAAHDALVQHGFGGAADEYSRAKQDLASSEVKDAIFNACKSYESVLKVLTGGQQLNADKLCQKVLEMGFLDDLPEEVRVGFTKTVMMCTPFLRNKLGGHGQGADVVSVPPVYGELAIQLTAALHNFLMAKYLERSPPSQPEHEPEKQKSKELEDDEIPF